MLETIKNDYAGYAKIKKAYDAARDAGIEEGVEAARKSMREFRKELVAKGEDYWFVYTMYQGAMDRGNELLDVDEYASVKDAAWMANAFRKFGVERFTVSIGSEKFCWEFVKNGCKLDGMTEINTSFERIDGEGFETKPAFVFVA